MEPINIPFYFTNGKDELISDIKEFLQKHKIDYLFCFEDLSINFKRVEDAIFFKFKMGIWEDKFKLKGNTQFDAGIFYCPYIPLQTTSISQIYKDHYDNDKN